MDTRNYDVIDPDFSQPDYLPPCDGGACRPCPPMCPPPRPLPPCRPPKPGCTSNSTPWYGLPQWAAGDVTSWLMQMNGAMLRIDTIMHDLALRTGINGLPDDLVSCVAKVSQDVEVIKCTVGELSNKQANVDLLMQNLNTQFSAMKTDVASLTLSVTNLDTRIMTVDSKADGMKNDIVLLKTDLNMLSKTVQNLTANFTSFQNTVNQSIAELQSETNELSVVTNTFNESIKNNSKWSISTISSAFSFDDNFNATSCHSRVMVSGNVAISAFRTPDGMLFKCANAAPPEKAQRLLEILVDMEGCMLIDDNFSITRNCSSHVMCKIGNGLWHPVNCNMVMESESKRVIFRFYLGDYPDFETHYTEGALINIVGNSFYHFGQKGIVV